MQRVFVLDANKRPLMPCRPARARLLLTQQRAALALLIAHVWLTFVGAASGRPT